MFQTILTSSHISVQGEFVKQLDDGRVIVRVGDTYRVGAPIAPFVAQGGADALSALAS